MSSCALIKCSMILKGLLRYPSRHFFTSSAQRKKNCETWEIHVNGEQQDTVCPGSSDPPEKILSLFASEIEVYTIF